MLRWLQRYGLTFILGVTTLVLGAWAWQGYQETSLAYQGIQTPVVISTVSRPTSTPLPIPAPLPLAGLPLTWHPETRTLNTSDGLVRFGWIKKSYWEPVIPGDVLDTLPENYQFIKEDGDIWTLLTEAGDLLYRWDPNLLVWVKTSDLPVKVVVNPSLPRVTILEVGTQEILTQKSDDQLIAIAPLLNPQDYGLVANKIEPESVIRVGEDPGNWYVLYSNSGEKKYLVWNVIKGHIENADVINYADPETGFKVNILLITDQALSAAKNFIYRFSIDAELFPKALFEYTLAINNFYTNHNPEFLEALKLQGETDPDIYERLDKMRPADIDQVHQQAMQVLRDDLKNLIPNRVLSMKLGGSTQIQTNNSLWFILRINDRITSAQGFTLNRTYDPFRNVRALVEVVASSENAVEIELTWNSASVVGGILVEMARELTAGGASGAYYSKSWRLRPSGRSTTDSMVFELCGKDIITRYIYSLQGQFGSKKVVPLFDSVSKNIPICLVEEITIGQ